MIPVQVGPIYLAGTVCFPLVSADLWDSLSFPYSPDLPDVLLFGSSILSL